MKKLVFRSMMVATLLVGSSSTLFAQQQMPQMPPIPVDKNVRIGQLDNGLTYYIRKNSLPENRADFYIAQKVGAILEEKNQRGLAHFLEHMAFNGTKNFPGNEKGLGIIPWCETVGIKFGVNLNAGTGIDQTVYNISNAPVREGVVDSCLLILHDWSNDLLLTDKEIDKERGVIHEEWRTTNSPMNRMLERALPTIYPGTKYADCLPIGTMEVIDHFPYKVLRDYYEKWYRPDLQGIIIVGDIDVDAIEAKIRKIFADVPKAIQPAERVYYPVPDNDAPIVTIEKDKEQPYVQTIFFAKHEATPNEKKLTLDYLVADYAKTMISKMFESRLNELRQSANPPFIQAAAEDDGFFVAKTKDAFTGVVVCKDEDIKGGITALLQEIERARRFGFTASEYARTRADYLRELESEFNERDKKKNDSYVNQYVNHFINGEPIPGIENEYAIINQVAPSIPVEAINGMLKELISEKNQVLSIFGPEKESVKYPTEQELKDLLNGLRTVELTAYVDKVSDEPLIAQEPVAGKIVSEKPNTMFGTTTLTLSNGAKVIIKKTDFKADEIKMYAMSLGGSSLFSNQEVAAIKVINEVATVGGIGNFSKVDLEKVLAGKKASVNPVIQTNTETMTGSCSPKDLETMLQLSYLSFTAPRKDDAAFTSYLNRTKATLKNQEAQPMVAFIDSINSTLYDNHPRATRMTSAMVDQIHYDKVMEMYKDRYKDASDFTFILVGNIDLAAAKPLIEKYIASLPSINRKESFKDTGLQIRKGEYKNHFTKEQEIEKSSIITVVNGSCKYTLKNQVLASMFEQILDIVYTEKVREEEGGTYGVSTGCSLSKYPNEEATLQIYFDTDPQKKEKLVGIINSELQLFAQNGPSDTNLNKVKEYMLKKNSENLKENSFWMSSISEQLYNGVNRIEGYEQIVNSITAKDLQKFAADLIKQKNHLEVDMTTAKK